MPKIATTICLAYISLHSFAQRSSSPLERSGLKDLLPNLNYIPAKSFNSLVYKGKDSVSSYSQRIASVQGFYISETEVTNKEYRQFVYYVRDSIAHTLLSDFGGGPNSIDWARSINWKDDRLDALMLSPDERIFGRKEIDPGKIVYAIDFFGKKETVSIYPDTLVWIRDFAYSYNEPLVKKYFFHSFYDNFPVVGVNLKQAMAFCQWKTGQVNAQLAAGHPADNTPKGKKADATYEVIIRLPSNFGWESAAFEEKDTVNVFRGNHKYNCNFGTMTDLNGLTMKDYKDDGYFYTGPVKSFAAGTYGLYDMKGNVAEWTSTSREEIMKGEVKPEKLKTSFIVKGGGWNSTPFYLQAGACQFFSVDAAHSFVGFRYVVDVIKK